MDLLASGSAVFRANNISAIGAAPEPSSFMLGAIALAALSALRRRRNPEKPA
jgi:MYXO-CTERM domain-containing protein